MCIAKREGNTSETIVGEYSDGYCGEGETFEGYWGEYLDGYCDEGGENVSKTIGRRPSVWR